MTFETKSALLRLDASQPGNSGTMSAKLDEELATITRKFVHRKFDNGYKNFEYLLTDLNELITRIPRTLRFTETWVRVANDLAGFVEEWFDPNYDLENVTKSVEFLEAYLLSFFTQFTQTQRARLKSIAMRTRKVVAESADSDSTGKELMENESIEVPAEFRLYEKLIAKCGADLPLQENE